MTAADRFPCPGAAELERLMRGELPRPEVLAVVRHLLTGCPRCVAVTRPWWGLGKRPPALKALTAEMSAMKTGGAPQSDRDSRGRKAS
jgi:hypothetical protein